MIHSIKTAVNSNQNCSSNKNIWRLLWRPFHRTTNLILFVILCSSSAVNAWELHGTVSDRNGAAVVAASIITDIQGLGVACDTDGAFSLLSDGPRPTRLSVSHVGFQPHLLSLNEKSFTESLVIVVSEMILKEQGMVVYGNRARAGETPVAYTDITAAELDRDYTVGDLPLALSSAPNVYTYAESGSQLGYSHVSIRGFDERRISVYVNGVPLNDPEDHVTYFVDLPDFTGSVRDIQIQRGIGSSLYADGAFGGSVNIVSSSLDQPRKFSFTTGIGEYWDKGAERWVGQTTRQNLSFSSGLIDGRYHIHTRFSRQSSGGYIENSASSGWAYFMSASRLDPKSTTTFNTYGGPIITHAAWNGISRDVYNANPRANDISYFNEGDNFNQPHYELHNTYQLNDKTVLSNTLYYIRGVGYFEQFKAGRDPLEFNIQPNSPAYVGGPVDIIVQQWVRKNQLGLNSSVEITHDRGAHSFGIAGYYFDSEHWGQINGTHDIDTNFVPGQHYYEYWGKKWNFSAFANERYDFTDKLSTQLSLQLRHISYDFRQSVIGAFVTGPHNQFSKSWTFASPRIGLNYKLNNRSSVFASVSMSSRTPRDVDLYDANDPSALVDLDVASERLYDFELGSQYRTQRFTAGVNLFYMLFDNEVIAAGIDDDGSPITDNASRSFHSGIELMTSIRPIDHLTVEANYSYNHNRYIDYQTNVEIWDGPWNPIGVSAIDYSDNVTPNFPEMIGNLIVAYEQDRYSVIYRFKGVGRQFIESGNVDSLAIAGFGTSAISASLKLFEGSTFGTIRVRGTLENIFDKLYIQSAWGLSSRPADDLNSVTGAGGYFPSAGRSFFVQLQMDMM